METSLRTRQARLTQDVILEALAAVVVGRGVADFSVQDVADRAGVAHRTVYRHFPTRDALLNALAAWTEQRMAEQGGLTTPEHPDQIAPLARRKFVALEQLAPLVLATLKLERAELVLAQQSARSAVAMKVALADLTAHLPPDVAEVVIALIRQVVSSRMWLTLREDEGISGARSGEVVAWAAETLLRELGAGGGPGSGGT